MSTFSKILVPVDASELADRSLEVALDLAASFDSTLIAMWVRPEPPDLEGGSANEDLSAIEGEAGGLAAQVERLNRGRVASDRILTEVRSGLPAPAIIKAAQEHLVDLVVMGTHGRRTLGQVFTGTISERVNAQTSASVLTIKPDGFPFLRE